MIRAGTIVTLLFVAGLGWPVAACEPSALEGVKDKAAADAATPEGRAYLKEFFTNRWRLAKDAASENCPVGSGRSGPEGGFVIALSIGENGLPTNVLVEPEDEAMRCLADGLKATRFIPPPHDEFAIYMAFKKTEPGTERRAAK